MNDSINDGLGIFGESASSFDVRRLLLIALSKKWILAFIMLVSLVLSQVHFMLSTPIYRADSLIQVESRVGPTEALSELGSIGGGNTALETQIEILKSRSVMFSVVEKLGLDIVVTPANQSGRAIRADNSFLGKIKKLAEVMGLRERRLEKEKIKVSVFDVPNSRIGSSYRLKIVDSTKVQVLDSQGVELGTVLAGPVVLLNTSAGQIKIKVDYIPVGRVGSLFLVKKINWQVATTSLQGSVKILPMQRNQDLVRLVHEGPNPKLSIKILDAVADTYLKKNINNKSEQAQRTLRFLEEQLPTQEASLTKAEAKLNSFLQKNKSLNLEIETQSLLTEVVRLEAELSKIDQRRVELSENLTAQHPAVRALEEKRASMRSEQVKLEKRIRNLPEQQQEALRLNRDVEVNSNLYTYLLNKSQELKLLKAGTVGNVRIIDYAAAGLSPIRPRKATMTIIGVAVGLVLGMIFVGFVWLLDRGVHDPSALEEATGLSVFGSVPFSAAQSSAARARKGKNAASEPVLAQSNRDDLAVEALRSLRTSMHFALAGKEGKLVSITGPSPGVGKSFVAVNLAYLLSEIGQNVLLIDADMRRGHIHEYLQPPVRGIGLSDLLVGDADQQSVIRHLGGEGVNVIPAGTVPPNPSELLLSQNFKNLIQSVREEYDIVIIDTPPVLAVTDPVIISSIADATFVVVKEGGTTVADTKATIKRLNGDGENVVSGLVFNGFRQQRGGYGYYNYYHYEYNS